MSATNTNAAKALDGLLAAMTPDARERLVIMERVKSQIVCTEDRDDAVKRELDDLLSELVTRLDPSKPLGPGNRVEARMLVLTGRTGAGKSSLLHRVISAHPSFVGYGMPDTGCRAVRVSAPSPCTPKALGVEACHALDYPISASRTLPYVYGRVRQRLEMFGKLLLHLDEVHSVTETAGDREAVQLRNMLKTILVSPNWPVVVVLSGHPEVVGFLEGPTESDMHGRPRADTKGELRRRSVFVELKPLSPSQAPMLAGTLGVLAAVAGMTISGDVEHVIIPRLMHASLYELGTVMQVAHDAIAHALGSPTGQAVLSVEHFRDSYARRTGCGLAVNPFSAPNWKSLDCRYVLKATRDEADAARAAAALR